VAKLGVAQSRVISAANLSRTLPPVNPPNFISRKEILDAVEIDQAGITLVVAPAGYGKTSLVAEYITTLEHPVIWLSFNDSDDTKSFNANFLQAVRNVIPEFGKWFSSSQVFTTTEIMTEVFSELGSLGGHFVLVLDDGRSSTGDAAPLANHLFRTLPKNVHTIILRRAIPSEAFVQLKALSNLKVIDQNKLKFSAEEVSIAASILGVSIERPEYQKALKKLNGWPAGVQLTLSNISRGWDASSSVLGETESANETNYLVENLLSTLKPAERKILESLAVAEEFSIEEAEIILQANFSLSKLNRFAVDGLFLKYSSEPINKYSFNTIVRNGLILNPTIADKELQQIHQRLCDHFADRGSYLKALEHAKFAGDQESYRNLFRQGMRQLIAIGRGKDLLRMADLVGGATTTGVLKRQTVELMGLTADFQYLAAQSLITEMLFTSRGTDIENFIKKFTSAVHVYIDFATGLTEHLEEHIATVLGATTEELDLAAIDKISILRVSAAKEIIYDNADNLGGIQKQAHGLAKDDSSAMALYFISAIDACTLLNNGEYKEAYVVANNVISHAEREGYSGIFGALDAMYVKARCLLEFSQIEESQKTFAQIKVLAESWKQYTWIYLAESFLARDFALAGNSTAALEIVRSERERALALSFKNGLNIYCDLTELFIRYTMKDWDRVGILLGRLPDFLLVQRVRAIHDFELGKKSTTFVVADLPERTATQQIYKLMAQTDQNIDQEKVALQLMGKALEIGARVGARETFLRQDASLLNLVIRIAGEKPTVYLEDLASQITSRLKSRSENLIGLSAALTKRELEILRHLATGRPISAIGTTLHISQNTMKTHLKNIYRKIGAGGRDEAVAKAKSLYIL
jgi:ATP/maltotriose-dependent transcriptional regulator MalT